MIDKTLLSLPENLKVLLNEKYFEGLDFVELHVRQVFEEFQNGYCLIYLAVVMNMDSLAIHEYKIKQIK